MLKDSTRVTNALGYFVAIAVIVTALPLHAQYMKTLRVPLPTSVFWYKVMDTDTLRNLPEHRTLVLEVDSQYTESGRIVITAHDTGSTRYVQSFDSTGGVFVDGLPMLRTVSSSRIVQDIRLEMFRFDGKYHVPMLELEDSEIVNGFVQYDSLVYILFEADSQMVGLHSIPTLHLSKFLELRLKDSSKSTRKIQDAWFAPSLGMFTRLKYYARPDKVAIDIWLDHYRFVSAAE